MCDRHVPPPHVDHLRGRLEVLNSALRVLKVGVERKVALERRAAREAAHIGGLHEKTVIEFSPDAEIHVHAVRNSHVVIDPRCGGLIARGYLRKPARRRGPD